MILPVLVAQVASMLVIVADDVAYTDMPSIPTPHVDSIASQGLTFTRAYAMPVCSASRESAFLGVWSIRHRRSSCIETGTNATNPITIPAASVTIADLAGGAGLETGLFGKWHLGLDASGDWIDAPGENGFDRWFATPASTSACEGVGYESWVYTDNGSAEDLETDYNTTKVASEAVAWISARTGPYFAWVSFNAAHIPLHEPPSAALPAGYSVAATDRGRYEAAVVAMDEAVGSLLAAADLSSTLVIFIGDNGTPPQATRPDQDAAKVKKTTFEDGIHVPLVVAGPGVVQGTTKSLVHFVDVYATVANLASAPNAGDGVSLMPILKDPEKKTRAYVYCGHKRPGTNDRTIVTDRWKYRENTSVGSAELYDLDADPLEESPFLEGSDEWALVTPILVSLMEAIED